jgi:paraquat-inducible protein B
VNKDDQDAPGIPTAVAVRQSKWRMQLVWLVQLDRVLSHNWLQVYRLGLALWPMDGAKA